MELNGTYLLKIIWLRLLPLQKGYEDYQPQVLSEAYVEYWFRVTSWKHTKFRMLDYYSNTGRN